MIKADRKFMKMMQKKHQLKAGVMIVLGALVLANVYWGLVNWPTFVGLVLIFGGLAKLIMCKKHIM